MKKLLLTAAAALSIGAAQAQLEVGAITPDFTLADINGGSQHLYQYLDSGYTVIIDISATWCGPCWAVHSSHVFEQLTDHYGPNGSISAKKIKVLLIEGDNTTTMADLQGSTSASQGDWIAGTNYPIIDNATLNNPYNLTAFPTFMVVCPNRVVSYAGAGYTSAMLQESFWTAYQGTCPVASQPKDAALVGSYPDLNVCTGTPTSLSAKLQNMGTAPLTAATVTAKVDGAVVGTQNWTGSLNTYGIADVTFPSYTPTGAGTISYEVSATGDASATNNTKQSALEVYSGNSTAVRIDIKTDLYPGEVAWTLKNGSTLIDSKSYTGNANDSGGVDASKLFSYNYTVPANACLQFEITDVYGDGMSAVTNAANIGFAKVYLDGSATPMITIAGDGYGSSAKKLFKSGMWPAGIESVINTNNISLAPNPATDGTTLTLEMASDVNANIQIVDAIGRVVYNLASQHLSAGVHKMNIPTTQLSAGTYNVVVATAEGKITKRLTVTK